MFVFESIDLSLISSGKFSEAPFQVCSFCWTLLKSVVSY